MYKNKEYKDENKTYIPNYLEAQNYPTIACLNYSKVY